MLDAFIIERIRQQQNRQRESAQVPLRIEVPDIEPPNRHREEREEKKEDRGIAIIDFSI